MSFSLSWRPPDLPPFQLSDGSSTPPSSPYKLSVTSSSDSISDATTSSSGVNTVKSVSPDGCDDDDSSSEVVQFDISVARWQIWIPSSPWIAPGWRTGGGEIIVTTEIRHKS